MLWIIYTLISAFFFGMKDILAKKVLNENIKPIELVFEEFLILFLILSLFFFTKIDFFSYETIWHLYLIKALIIFITTEVYFKLLEKYEISTVTPLLNLSPIFLLILSSLFLSELITTMQVIGILVILFSTYYLEIIIHHHDSENPHLHHFNLISEMKSIFFIFTIILLVGVSFTAVIDKIILEKTNVFTNMFFTSGIILFFLFFYYSKKHNLFQTFTNMKKNNDLLIISLFTNISNFLILFAIAIPGALVSLIVPLRRTSTVFSSLIGGILFHEKHLLQKMISILIMLLGVFLIISKELYPIINLLI